MQNNARCEENCICELEVWKESIHVGNIAFNYFLIYKLSMIVLYNMMKSKESFRIICFLIG